MDYTAHQSCGFFLNQPDHTFFEVWHRYGHLGSSTGRALSFSPYVVSFRYMTEKKSIASKANWAKLSKEERSRKMSLLAKRKWVKVDEEDRRKYALKMVKARIKKYAKQD